MRSTNPYTILKKIKIGTVMYYLIEGRVAHTKANETSFNYRHCIFASNSRLFEAKTQRDKDLHTNDLLRHAVGEDKT